MAVLIPPHGEPRSVSAPRSRLQIFRYLIGVAYATPRELLNVVCKSAPDGSRWYWYGALYNDTSPASNSRCYEWFQLREKMGGRPEPSAVEPHTFRGTVLYLSPEENVET